MITQQRQIAFDTETTGLDYKKGDRIIEIGAVELIDRQVTGNDFHTYLNPDCEIHKGAVAVHGLTEQFLADKPSFSEIVDSLIQFIQGAELIIHNAVFDCGFLNHELSLLPQKLKPVKRYCKVLDTLTLARQLHPGSRNSLDALCKRYRIDNTHRQRHGALIDAKILAKVYLAMTGGQASLFTEGEKQQQKDAQANISKISARRGALPVIRANSEELKADATFREFIRKQ